MSGKYAIPDRKELVKGVRVIVHAKDGKQIKATIVDEPTRADYPLLLQDGSSMTATRKELELDPQGDELPPAAVFTKHGVPMKFMVLHGDDRESLCADIQAHGGQLATSEGPTVIVIHAGDDTLAPLCNSAVHSKRLIRDALQPGASFPDKDNYVLRSAPGTTTSSGSRAKYSVAEDRKLIEFVNKMSAQGCHTKGKKMWLEAERLKVTGRSWQSMREHYIKSLERDFKKLQHKRAMAARAAEADADPIVSDGEGPAVEEPASKRPKQGAAAKQAVQEEAAEADEETQDEEDDDLMDAAELKAKQKKMRRDAYVAKVEQLMDKYQVKKSVVIHAFIIFSGELAKAEKYLACATSTEEELEAWRFEDDEELIANTEINFDKPPATIKEIMARRSHDAVVKRHAWIHSCDSEDSEDPE